jgi:phosphopantothenate-cysteine ligase
MNVPLEKNTVRFIANFSRGTRGANSTEEFLNQNYAVLYLHHSTATRPFKQHANFTTDDFKIDENGRIYVKECHKTEKIKPYLSLWEKVKNDKMLLEIEYVTVFEYLLLLEISCKALSVLKSRAIVYTAAAVSDFYIPHDKMAEHKIQSRNVPIGELHLVLQQTPKMLGKIKTEWCPEAMLITFKLESDPNVINQKVADAFRLYNMDMVLSNLLNSYEHVVNMHEKETNAENPNGTPVEKEGDQILEKKLITAIIHKHRMFNRQ